MVNIKGESNVIHSKLQKCSSYAQGYKTQNTMTNIQRVEYRCTTNSTVFIATVTLLNPVNLQVDQTALLLFSAQIVEFMLIVRFPVLQFVMSLKNVSVRL